MPVVVVTITVSTDQISPMVIMENTQVGTMLICSSVRQNEWRRFEVLPGDVTGAVLGRARRHHLAFQSAIDYYTKKMTTYCR
jgi:hypothetical protein